MVKRALYLTLVVVMLLAALPAVASAAPPSPVACEQDYTVALADWLSKLSDLFYGDVLSYPAIVMATNMKAAEDSSYAVIVDPDVIEPGWKLCVPSADDATTLLGTSVRIHLETKDIGPNNPFWQIVWDGAQEMANKWQGVIDYTVNAPTSESDVDTQIAQLEDAITTGAEALIVAPTDASALNPTFDRAKEAGIPVLIIDSNTTWPDKLTFIGTDNVAGGRLAGQYLCDQIGSTGKVAIITGQETAASIADRVQGAQEAFDACGLEVVAKINGEHSREGGLRAMEDILASNPDVPGVFCINDNEALGAVEALKAAGKMADVKLVGFDANPDAITSILAGDMSATIAQAPANMGRFGVAWSMNYLMGLEVPPLIDTGTTLVTADNAASVQ
ncbi:MAG: substrate-binding domain-containing protein [Anaerolineae bacterium]